MSKEKRIDIKTLFWDFLVILAAFQLVCGVCWIFGKINIGAWGGLWVNGGEQYLEKLSLDYISASVSLRVDDYMGIMYALLARTLGSGIGLFLFQMACLFASIWNVGNALNLRMWKKIVLLGVLLFNPIILQSVFTILPNALVLACLFFILAGLIKFNFAEIVIGELIIGFLNPDYALIIGMVLIPFAIWRVVKKKKQSVLLLACVLIISIGTVFVNGAISSPYEYGRVERNFGYLMVQRLVYGHVNEAHDMTYVYHGRDFYDEMMEGDKVPEKLGTVFAASFKEYAGEYELNQVYEYLYKLAITKGVGYYGKAIIRDFFYYLFTPFTILYVYLSGKTDTLMFNPLLSFADGNVTLSMLYIGVSISALFVLVLVYAWGLLFKKISIKQIAVNKKAVCIGTLGFVILLAFYSMFFLLRGFDYRNTLFTIAVIPVWGIFLLEGNED